jgi:hypothetical protein
VREEPTVVVRDADLRRLARKHQAGNPTLKEPTAGTGVPTSGVILG